MSRVVVLKAGSLVHFIAGKYDVKKIEDFTCPYVRELAQALKDDGYELQGFTEEVV